LLLGSDIWKLLILVPSHLAPHYSIEYRKHFTKVHVTVVGLFGATEHLCINMFFFIVEGILPETNHFALREFFNIGGYSFDF
jgi:hypothetical protein